MIGKKETDDRFKRLPRAPGYRCFSAGISKMSQWSIKDARDVERYAVGVATGRLHHRALRALRAEVDYIYTTEYEQNTENDLEDLIDYNKIWHQNKKIFIDPDIGGRRGKKGVMKHFNIPKVHAKWHFPDNIRDCGASRNFSAQITERYHIDIVKDAYAATNRRNVIPQMIGYLNRQERILQHDDFRKWRDQVVEPDDPDDSKQLETGAEVEDDEQDGDDAPTHHLNKSPALVGMSLSRLTAQFELADGQLEAALTHYWDGKLPPEWKKLDVWLHTRVTLPTLAGDERKLYERILARPGTGHQYVDKVPRFHTVFVDDKPHEEAAQDGLAGKYCP
jgi:hypothetical protein